MRGILALPRKGDVIRLGEKRGIVIDCGVFNRKYNRYLLSKAESADSIRVWTSGAIEVWPADRISGDSEAA